jgi:hypothetical protein
MNKFGLLVLGAVLVMMLYFKLWLKLFLIILWALFSYLLVSQNGEKADPLLYILILHFFEKSTSCKYPFLIAAATASILSINLDYTQSISKAIFESRLSSYSNEYIDVFGQSSLLIRDESKIKSNDYFNKIKVENSSDAKSQIFKNINDRQLNNTQEGIALHDAIIILKNIVLSDDVIVNLSFSNPFSFYFRTRPPKNVLQWLDINRNWSHSSLTIDKIIGNATIIVQPKLAYDWPNSEAPISFVYRELCKNWIIVNDSDYWSVWRKKG